MNRRILALATLTTLSFASTAISDPYTVSHPVSKEVVTVSAPVQDTSSSSFLKYLEDIYDEADLKQADLKFDVFQKAAIGFYNLQKLNKISKNKNILSIIDFSKPSREKRLWIVDLNKKKVLYHSLVAHGEGSGSDKAVKFSNTENSHMSSLGFYVTTNTYHGKHGLSLKLNGLDKGFNTNALQRAIVVHGADYVSESFVKQHGRLGRSHGCPALPSEITPAVIQLIKGGTCLYIDGPVTNYQSAYLNTDTAIKNFEQEIIAKQAQMLGGR